MINYKLISTLNLILTLCFINGFSQEAQDSTSIPIDEDTKLITYKDVVEETGTKDEFFNRAIEWINSYYKNPVDVTKVRDPESGKIKGLHRIKLKRTDKNGNILDAGTVQYSFLLEFKEDKYRYTLTEFVLRDGSKFPAEKWLIRSEITAKNSLTQIHDFALTWIKELKKGLQYKPKKKDDEW